MTLKELLPAHEERLMARALRYAKEQGFTAYTSTLLEAWRLSISGLTKSILETEAVFAHPPELGPEDDYRSDPTAPFGILEAKRRLERGVSLGMLLGLTKYYRQSFVDLVDEKVAEGAARKEMRRFAARCFDRIKVRG